MAIQEKISLELLGDIIKGLKLDDFAYVETDALFIIKSMIKCLPERESLGKLSFNPNNIDAVLKDVGKIMRLIELYGKRDLEYKTRYRAKTQLDPRYKVLDNNTQKAANRVAKGLIKVSAILDNDDKISSELIRCAMKAHVGGLTKSEMAGTTADIFEKLGFSENAKFFREAITEYNIDMQEIRRELGQIFRAIQNAKNLTEKKYDDMTSVSRVNPNAEKVVDQLSTIWKDLLSIENSANRVIDRLDATTTKVEKDMMDVVPKNAYIANIGSFPINYINDPTQEGWQIATVEYKGKIYEVQEDSKGNQSLKPHNPAMKSESVIEAKKPEAKQEVKPEVKEEPKSIAQEYIKVRPMMEKLLQNNATLPDLRAIKDFIQTYKNKREISKAPSMYAFRGAFNLSKHLFKLAQNADDVRKFLESIVEHGVDNTSKLDPNYLDKLENYVDALIGEAEKREVPVPATPPKRVSPPMEISTEILEDPNQSKNMFFQLMQKKKAVSEEDDQKFIENELKLFNSLDRSTEIDIKYSIVTVLDPAVAKKGGFDQRSSKETQKYLKDLSNNFYNKALYQEFLDKLSVIKPMPPKKEKVVSEPLEETEETATIMPEKEPEKLRVETPEEPLPQKSLNFLSLKNKAKMRLQTQLYINKIKLEDLPPMADKLWDEKTSKEAAVQNPKATKNQVERAKGRINAIMAELTAIQEVLREETPVQSFNLSKHLKLS